MDDNKKNRFAIGALFLQLYGWILVAREVDSVLQTLALATGEIKEKEYAYWLAAKLKRALTSTSKQSCPVMNCSRYLGP